MRQGPGRRRPSLRASIAALAIGALAPQLASAADGASSASGEQRPRQPAISATTWKPPLGPQEVEPRPGVLRFYDPKTGRFVSRDPLGLWGDEAQAGNGQGYCGHNPVNRVDPWGDWSPSGAFSDGFQAGIDELGESLYGLTDLDLSDVSPEALADAILGALTGAGVAAGLGKAALKKLVPGAVLAELLWIIGRAGWRGWNSCDPERTYWFELGKGIGQFVTGFLGGAGTGLFVKGFAKRIRDLKSRMTGPGGRAIQGPTLPPPQPSPPPPPPRPPFTGRPGQETDVDPRSLTSGRRGLSEERYKAQKEMTPEERRATDRRDPRTVNEDGEMLGGTHRTRRDMDEGETRVRVRVTHGKTPPDKPVMPIDELPFHN